MRLQVNQSGDDERPGHVDHTRIGGHGGGAAGPDGGDASVGDGHVGIAEDLVPAHGDHGAGLTGSE
jgi:hypothetical protein